MNALSLIGVIILIFMLGAFTTVMWRYFSGHEHTSVRKMNLLLSMFFTLIALSVTADLLILTNRFNHYVAITVKRDETQEKCEQDTLKVLRLWSIARHATDEANKDRDASLVPLFEQLERGEKVDPGLARDVLEAFHHSDQARDEHHQLLEQNPLPDCKLGVFDETP